MEILNNFSSIYCFITFIIGAVFMLAMLSIAAMGKVKEPRNNVRFYVARDENDELFLYMGKPFRGINKFHPYQNGCIITSDDDLSNFGLNKDDYANLKWEDEPVEVFLNLKNDYGIGIGILFN